MDAEPARSKSCPRCGATLAADALEGLCPTCLLAGAMSDAPHPPADAEALQRIRAELEAHLPDLEVKDLLGRGGMGFVFRGLQKRLSREVAIKVLLPELAEKPLFSERFEREARTLARLNHPNIVHVHDFGRAGSLYYLVLEFVDGTNLRQAIRSKSVGPAQALQIVREICDALEFAHGAGVVHRDIKPENILLDLKGRVRIADFGLAKLVGDVPGGATLTSSGQVMGSLRYMAPEQMDRPLEVDHRADIYSLGVVFYEMLTGEIPMGSFAPPSHKVHVDVRIDEVVIRSLAKEPERRYQHAIDVKTEVDRIGSTPGTSSPAPAKTPATPPSTGRELSLRGPIGLAVCAAGLFVLLPLFAVIGQRREAVAIEAVRTHALVMQGFASPEAISVSGGRGFGVMLAPLFVIQLAAFGACAWLGWSGLRRIRAEWPRLWGVGAAATAAWLPVLALADALILGAAIVPMDLVAGRVGESFVGMLVVGVLGLNVWFLVWWRARFLRVLEPGAKI